MDSHVSPPDDHGPEAPPGIEGGLIAGVVTDFSGFPLVGVRVEAAIGGGADLDLLPVMTDGQGGFELHGLADGAYDLRFELGRVQARVLGVPVGKQDLQVQLARPQGLLLIVKTLDHDALPGLLHVLLEREVKGGRVREYVGRHFESRLLLWSIRPGIYHVTVWGGRYIPVTAHGVRVREGVPAPEVQLLLTAAGRDAARARRRRRGRCGVRRPRGVATSRGSPRLAPPSVRRDHRCGRALRRSRRASGSLPRERGSRRRPLRRPRRRRRGRAHDRRRRPAPRLIRATRARRGLRSVDRRGAVCPSARRETGRRSRPGP